MRSRRWTIRGVPEWVRQTIDRLCQCTGMSAGQAIAAAVEHFVTAHPEAVRESHPDDDDALDLLLQALRAMLIEQERLFAKLAGRKTRYLATS